MKILTRYIFREMLGPTLLGFLFYTSIIIMRQLFDMAGLIIKRSLAGAVIGRLLLLSLPNIIVLTIPMSLLFGILIAIGRLSSDSEIIAMRALGISTRTIYRPVFFFSFLVFLVNLYLMNVLLPRGNTELNRLKSEVLASSLQKEVKPRVFYPEFENLMIYVNDIDPHTGEWKGVFVADNRTDETQPAATTPQQMVDQSKTQDANASSDVFSGQKNSQKVVVAEHGTLSAFKKSHQVWMNLRNAQTHFYDPRKPDHYDLNTNITQRILLSDKFDADPAAGRWSRSLREMNLRELLEQVRLLRGTRELENYNLAKVEIHKKFAIPFACVIFGVLGLPLGITNRRGGKSSGFSLSIAIILFYWIMITNGEQMAQSGRIGPGLGMWAPNLLLLALGVFLLGRANRDSGGQKVTEGPFRRLSNWIAQLVTRKRRVPSGEEQSSILNRLDITFPNILDRYVIREFLKFLALVFVSVAALAIIVDYNGISAEIRANHIAFHTVAAYYRFMIFQIINWTLPISVLVTTLITFGVLSKNNEVTALKAGGVSLYRVALPVVLIATLLSVFSYFLLDFVLPYANERREQLANKIKGKGPVAVQTQQKTWFLGKGRYLINFLAYDKHAQELSQVQVFELHPTAFRLTRRVFAQHAKWDGTGWVFSNGWIRSFPDDRTSTFSIITTPLRLQYAERPEDFATEVKRPEQMTFGELRRYIATIRRSGYAAEELSVNLYQKTSWPAICLIMALIALPFAFRMGKRGALHGIGIALLLGICYWILYAVFSKFGEVGNLPAILSAWAANILFGLAAVYMFLDVET